MVNIFQWRKWRSESRSTQRERKLLYEERKEQRRKWKKAEIRVRRDRQQESQRPAHEKLPELLSVPVLQRGSAHFYLWVPSMKHPKSSCTPLFLIPTLSPLNFFFFCLLCIKWVLLLITCNHKSLHDDKLVFWFSEEDQH